MQTNQMSYSADNHTSGTGEYTFARGRQWSPWQDLMQRCIGKRETTVSVAGSHGEIHWEEGNR